MTGEIEGPEDWGLYHLAGFLTTVIPELKDVTVSRMVDAVDEYLDTIARRQAQVLAKY